MYRDKIEYYKDVAPTHNGIGIMALILFGLMLAAVKFGFSLVVAL